MQLRNYEIIIFSLLHSNKNHVQGNKKKKKNSGIFPLLKVKNVSDDDWSKACILGKDDNKMKGRHNKKWVSKEDGLILGLAISLLKNKLPH